MIQELRNHKQIFPDLFHFINLVDILSFFYGHPNIFTDFYGQIVLGQIFTDCP